MRQHRRIPIIGVVGYTLCVLAMIWPGALLANRIEPMVFGLPFFFFWYVLWAFVLFVTAVATYRLEEYED